MALVEERVKSTLQGLQAMIKASEAQDAGAGCWLWGPPVISWFIRPSNYSYKTISTINHSYWSFLHQLSYLGGSEL
jgi:hypothetical protein